MNPIDALVLLAIRAGAEVVYSGSTEEEGGRLVCRSPDSRVVEAFRTLANAVGGHDTETAYAEARRPQPSGDSAADALANLAALCELATPGPWALSQTDHGHLDLVVSTDYGEWDNVAHLDMGRVLDAEFIAATDPTVVRALIDVAREADAEWRSGEGNLHPVLERLRSVLMREGDGG